MSERIRVRISDPEHPHYPETGWLNGKGIVLLGKQMAEMDIDNCKHGTSGCFVSAGQVSQIVEPRAPRRSGRR